MIRLLLSLTTLAIALPAKAQERVSAQMVEFSLTPRSSPFDRILPGSKDERSARIDPLVPVDSDDRSHDVRFGLHRAAQRLTVLTPSAVSASALLPLSRLTRYQVEDHMPIGDFAMASLGWHGVRISNRQANVTAGLGSDRLRTRDWFLPRAALVVRPAPGLSAWIDYAETLRAFGGTGMVGPMGLTDGEFQALRRTLKPETQNRMQVQGNWMVDARLTISLSAHRGRLDDRLGFAGRGLLPVNAGSARIDGAVLEAGHVLTPHLGWSLRYDLARVDVAAGQAVRERSLSLATRWEKGPLRASARIARTSRAAIAINRYRAVRLEAGIDYALATIARRPLRLSLRLTDPDGLASSSFALDDLSGPRHAADLARTVMASAQFDW